MYFKILKSPTFRDIHVLKKNYKWDIFLSFNHPLSLLLWFLYIIKNWKVKIQKRERYPYRRVRKKKVLTFVLLCSLKV